MYSPFLNADWQTILVAVLFFGVLIVALFRLDAFLAAPRRRRPRSLLVKTDKDGRMVITDPDGRPWPGFGASK